MEAAQCSGAYCGFESDFGQEIEAILDGGTEEDAANNRETHIREIGDSMHAAQCGGTALDAVVCRAEQVSQQPVGIPNECSELKEFVNLHETEASLSVQN